MGEDQEWDGGRPGQLGPVVGVYEFGFLPCAFLLVVGPLAGIETLCELENLEKYMWPPPPRDTFRDALKT